MLAGEAILVQVDILANLVIVLSSLSLQDSPSQSLLTWRVRIQEHN